MIGRLALGLMGGLGKGMLAAGGGKVALELAKMALGGRGKGSGGRGGKAGGGGRGGQGADGRQQEAPLEELLRVLSDKTQRRDAGNVSFGKEAPLDGATHEVYPESDGAAAMTVADEAALRCLTAHIVSFTEGRVRLRHPALRAAAVPDELRREMLEHPGLREVTFNAVTGSALLLYDAGQLDRPELLAALLPLGRYLVLAAARAGERA